MWPCNILFICSKANDRISSLEEDLDKTKGSASTQLETIASLEQHLHQARTAESEAKQRFMELQDQLAKSSFSQDDDKLEKLENELKSCKEKEHELTEKISRHETSEKDVAKYKRQLDNAANELAHYDNEVKTLKSKLLACHSLEEELKKKVVSLEEALAKASNDLGKSQV